MAHLPSSVSLEVKMALGTAMQSSPCSAIRQNCKVHSSPVTSNGHYLTHSPILPLHADSSTGGDSWWTDTSYYGHWSEANISWDTESGAWLWLLLATSSPLRNFLLILGYSFYSSWKSCHNYHHLLYLVSSWAWGLNFAEACSLSVPLTAVVSRWEPPINHKHHQARALTTVQEHGAGATLRESVQKSHKWHVKTICSWSPRVSLLCPVWCSG